MVFRFSSRWNTKIFVIQILLYYIHWSFFYLICVREVYFIAFDGKATQLGLDSGRQMSTGVAGNRKSTRMDLIMPRVYTAKPLLTLKI